MIFQTPSKLTFLRVSGSDCFSGESVVNEMFSSKAFCNSTSSESLGARGDFGNDDGSQASSPQLCFAFQSLNLER